MNEKNTMMISVNTQYADLIMQGIKKYEYRKAVCRNEIKHILFYATNPTKAIVGEADIKRVLVDSPEKIWELTNEDSGVTKEQYNLYFNKKEKAVAYQLIHVKAYDKQKKLSEYGLKNAPQSYVYL